MVWVSVSFYFCCHVSCLHRASVKNCIFFATKKLVIVLTCLPQKKKTVNYKNLWKMCPAMSKTHWSLRTYYLLLSLEETRATRKNKSHSKSFIVSWYSDIPSGRLMHCPLLQATLHIPSWYDFIFYHLIINFMSTYQL